MSKGKIILRGDNFNDFQKFLEDNDVEVVRYKKEEEAILNKEKDVGISVSEFVKILKKAPPDMTIEDKEKGD